MKKLWLVLLLILFQGDIPWKEAIQEFEKKNYKKASQIFQKFAQEKPIYSPYLSYNAGLSELLSDSLKQSQWFFQQSLVSSNPYLKSEAYNHLGYIFEKQKKYEEALNYWKLALKENPQNELARYNYELFLRKKPKLDLPPPPPPSDEKSSKVKKNKNHLKNQDIGDNELNTNQLGLNEVESILDAMENQEKKFIQQLRKRNKSPKLYEGSDW